MSRTPEELHEVILLLREEAALLKEENRILRQIRDGKKLSFIKISIGGKMPVGPVTLAVGDKKVVSVLGFDQNGAPIAIDFKVNPVVFTDDNQSVVQDTPDSPVSDPITALAPGVANLTATCAGFVDTEAVTVIAAAPKLSSIKISID